METPVVFFSGMDQELVVKMMRACKAVAKEAGIDPGNMAFSMATATNREWKVSDLLEEVAEEHRQMSQMMAKGPSPKDL